MHTFTDNAGRTWTVAINVAAIKRVRGLLHIDLYKLVDDKFKGLSELIADPVQLADVLYCLCQEEADKKGISDEAFGRALAGDCIASAADCFLEELVCFFQNERMRAGLRKVIAKGRTVQDRLLRHAEKLADEIDPEQEASTLISSFTSSPASSASTPDLSPSAN